MATNRIYCYGFENFETIDPCRPQCDACRTDYRYGYDVDMQEIKPSYPVPAIRIFGDILLSEDLEPIVTIEQRTSGVDNGRYWSVWEILRIW